MNRVDQSQGWKCVTGLTSHTQANCRGPSALRDPATWKEKLWFNPIKQDSRIFLTESQFHARTDNIKKSQFQARFEIFKTMKS